MKIATIQMCPVFKKPKENITKLTKLIQLGVQGGAKLIVAPELVTTGYSFMNREEAEPFAEVVGRPDNHLDGTQSIPVMRLLARRWNVTIIWGFLERDALTGKLYNSQAYVDPHGSFISYRKINRFSADWLWSEAGDQSPPVIRTTIDGRVWKIGLLICRDVRDKMGESDIALYAKGDADVVTLSAAWGKGGFPATAWMDFVKDNACYLVVANRYGEEIPNDFGLGGIGIISPTGRVQCEGLKWGEDCVVFGEIV